MREREHRERYLLFTGFPHCLDMSITHFCNPPMFWRTRSFFAFRSFPDMFADDVADDDGDDDGEGKREGKECVWISKTVMGSRYRSSGRFGEFPGSRCRIVRPKGVVWPPRAEHRKPVAPPPSGGSEGMRGCAGTVAPMWQAVATPQIVCRQSGVWSSIVSNPDSSRPARTHSPSPQCSFGKSNL